MDCDRILTQNSNSVIHTYNSVRIDIRIYFIGQNDYLLELYYFVTNFVLIPALIVCVHNAYLADRLNTMYRLWRAERGIHVYQLRLRAVQLLDIVENAIKTNQLT